MGRYAPSKAGFRKPTDTAQRNGPTHNPPRALKFGGKGNTRLIDVKPDSSHVGPISDRGKGRR